MTENVNYFRLNPRLEKEIKMDSTNEIELSELLLAAFDFAEKNKNIAYGVNANCIESLPAISELNCAFINKVNFKKHKDIF